MYYDDSVIEQSTVQKLIVRLLPMLCLLSMATTFATLSLGYAAPTMAPALGMTDSQLRLAGDAFYLGYLLATLPAAWLMLYIGARRLIAVLVVASGAIAMLLALAPSDTAPFFIRLLLGMAEANLLPAMVFYLCEWVPARHRGKAIPALIAAAALVPVLGGEFSNLLLFGLHWFAIADDWRWLLFAEGVPALWFGLFVMAVLPQTFPEARWLPHPERHWLAAQRQRDMPLQSAATFVEGLRSRPIWKLAAAQGAIGLVAGSIGMWVPLAMQRSGYLDPATGAIIMGGASVVGALIALVVGLPWHNRTPWRWALTAGLVLVGFCLLVAAVLPNGTGGVLMLAIVAVLIPVIVTLTWLLAPFVLSGAAAAAGFALIGMAGALGELIASELAVVRHDAATRCVVLALACLGGAWLAFAMERPLRLTRKPAASASAGE